MKKPFIVDDVTKHRQSLASDPKNTVWVSANAGSGKTHVLSQRVIRLLLEGTPPSKILCLTYTKTAASEMINRVFERLSAWIALDDRELTSTLFEIEKRQPDAAQLRNARTLFARALETPGGLQIQTIHAFCTTILKRFPLEANIIGHFELLDDTTNELLKSQAKQQLSIKVSHGGDEALSRAFEKALDAAGEKGLDILLNAGLSGPSRSTIFEFVQLQREGSISSDVIDKVLGLGEGDTTDTILNDFWPLTHMPIALMQQLIESARPHTSVKIPQFANDLCAILSEEDPQKRFDLLKKRFLDKNGESRSPRDYKKLHPDFEAIFQNSAQEVLAVQDAIKRCAMAQLSQAAYVLLNELMTIHVSLKRMGGFLDYDDLIDATNRLLQKDEASAWVHYKLDQGIDHVLVDEAQDTSTRQWSILETLTSDFFNGDTASNKKRTLFVVGDEKQSIYSFQGAQPDVFIQTGRDKARQLKNNSRSFEQVTFSLSFRSTPEVLQAVDYVFKDLFVSDHVSIRNHQHGHVEVWESIKAEKGDDEDNWTKPVDKIKAAPLVLARDVAMTIEQLLNSHKNPATGKIVRPGDILVLVRKRDQFMNALSKELKQRNIPVAGADRLVLTSHIAILDLMACARVVLQPHDDLSLAALLKSPIFGLSEEALIDLASARDGKISLMQRLKERAETNPHFLEIINQCQQWRDEVDTIAVYEFFARILSRDGKRAKFIAQLGEEACDVIDEFLSFALVAERSGLLGLEAFIESLTRAAPEIKRESSAQRNEVRIMTVHGAKGLESPYVFLIDPGNSPVTSQHKAPLMEIETVSGNKPITGFVWAPKKEYHNSSVFEHVEQVKQKQLEEYNRLLYVGMTRAEDVLIVCGYKSSKPISYHTWIDKVRQGLEGKEGTSEREHPITKKPVLYFELGKTQFDDESINQNAEILTHTLPNWLTQKLPPVITPPYPLIPSDTGKGLMVEDAEESSPVFEVKKNLPNHALERGSVIHKLLEVLPSFSEADRLSAATRYLDRTLPNQNHEELLNNVWGIINNKSLNALFSSQSRAEVSVSGQLVISGVSRSINGIIDRLVVTDSHVLIVDYKTSTTPPLNKSDIPNQHIKQLALYRALLKPLYGDKPIEAALIYTQGPSFFPVESDLLDNVLHKLNGR
jgi:ATP-dependent helicase/nuclease subunit A